MNGNEQFIPAWANQVLSKPDAEALADVKQELEMLRAFFSAWENLHAIPNVPKNRQKAEQAAQMLVDAAHAIRALRAGDGAENAV